MDKAAVRKMLKSGELPSNLHQMFVKVQEDQALDVGNDTCPFSQSTQNACDASRRYRSIDGSCNNLQHATWGRSLTPLHRLLDPDYEDGEFWRTARKAIVTKYRNPIFSISIFLYGSHVFM